MVYYQQYLFNQARPHGPLWPRDRPRHATKGRGKARQHRNNGADTIDERDPEIPPRLLEQGEYFLTCLASVFHRYQPGIVGQSARRALFILSVAQTTGEVLVVHGTARLGHVAFRSRTQKASFSLEPAPARFWPCAVGHGPRCPDKKPFPLQDIANSGRPWCFFSLDCFNCPACQHLVKSGPCPRLLARSEGR